MHFLWIYIQTPTHPRCIIQVRFSTMWPPRRKLVFYMKIKHWTKNTWPCSAPASLQTGQSEPNITRLLPKTFKQCDTKVLQRIYYVWCLTNNSAETWKCLAPTPSDDYQGQPRWPFRWACSAHWRADPQRSCPRPSLAGRPPDRGPSAAWRCDQSPTAISGTWQLDNKYL